ncbi:hypothetical protein J2W92_004857 [Rhizobium leguminosarum]
MSCESERASKIPRFSNASEHFVFTLSQLS